MKKSLAALSALNFCFIFLLSISGSLEGTLSDVVYYLSFVISVALFFAASKRLEIPLMPPRVTISRGNIGIILAFMAPSLCLIFLVSYLTSLALSHFGTGAIADASGNLFFVMLTYAVITPILEEMLFRYIPLSLLAQHSKKGAILYSAAFFAFVHCSLYQLPYAFLAGVIFAFFDIISESIIPSLLLHTMNNAISVLWLRYSGDALFSRVYVIILLSLALASIPIIIALRGKLKKRLELVRSDQGKIPLSIGAFAFFGATLLIAFINL